MLVKRWMLLSMVVIALAGCRAPTAAPSTPTRLPSTALPPITTPVATSVATQRATTAPTALGTPMGTTAATPRVTGAATGMATSAATSAVGTPRPTGMATGMATGAATSAVGTPRPATTGTAPAGTPRAALAAPPLAGWQTARLTLAPDMAYSISLPPGWRIETPATPAGTIGTVTSIYSYPPDAAGVGGSPLSPTQTKIDIVPLTDQTGRTVAEIIASSLTGPGVMVSDTKSLEINGIPASWVELDTPQGKSVAVFLMLEPQPIVVQAYGDMTPLAAILATFRPVV